MDRLKISSQRRSLLAVAGNKPRPARSLLAADDGGSAATSASGNKTSNTTCPKIGEAITKLSTAPPYCAQLGQDLAAAEVR